MRSRRPMMNLIVGFFLLSLSSCLLLFHSPSASAAPVEWLCYPTTGSASINGKVTKPGGSPLQSVTVEVYNNYGVRAGYASTDASGEYSVNNLIAGTYFLKVGAHHEGYVGEWYNNAQKAVDATPIVLSNAEIKSGVNVELALGAKISGTVTDQASNPLENVQVRIYNADKYLIANTSTNASGNYSTRTGLTNGTYYVQFQHYEKVPIYYPNASSIDAAEAIVISSPTNYTVNAQLQEGITLTGQISDAETDAALSGVEITISGENLSKYATSTAGAFSIKGLRPGQYRLNASSYFDSWPYVRQTRLITIPNGVTSYNVDLAIPKGGSISGKVTDTDGNPLASITIFISNEDGSYQEYVYTNASGIYSANGMPDGKFQVHFRPYTYIEEYYDDANDRESATLVEIRNAEAKTGIDAQLALGSSISGKVTDAESNDPIQGVSVVVLNEEGYQVASATSQADGSYTTQTILPSGKYRVKFTPDDRNGSCGYVLSYNHGASSEEEAPFINITAPTPVSNLNVALKRGAFVSGSVKDTASNQPVTQGRIRIYDQAGKQVGSARITEFGTFLNSTGLPSGSYYLHYIGDEQGYVDTFYPNAASREAASVVDLEAPNLKTGINFQLQKGSLIKGKALLAGSSIAFQNGSIIVYSQTGEKVAYAWIEKDGTYSTTPALRSGQYYVAAVPYYGEEGIASLASSPSEPQRIISFYRTDGGAAPSMQSASLLSLTAPTNLDNIDISVYYGSFLPLALQP